MGCNSEETYTEKDVKYEIKRCEHNIQIAKSEVKYWEQTLVKMRELQKAKYSVKRIEQELKLNRKNSIKDADVIKDPNGIKDPNANASDAAIRTLFLIPSVFP